MEKKACLNMSNAFIKIYFSKDIFETLQSIKFLNLNKYGQRKQKI